MMSYHTVNFTATQVCMWFILTSLYDDDDDDDDRFYVALFSTLEQTQ